jgi:GxxExxY protein
MHAEHADNSGLNELSGRVIGCAFTVLNTLGAGFLEKVCENVLAYEFRATGLSAVQQYGAKVHYKDILVGEYFVDLLINDVLLVELKTVKTLDDAHMPRALDREGGCSAPII